MSKILKSNRADVAFASLFSGALGSAAIALVFLVVDAVRGDPFSTPSLMGSVLFLGASPSDVSMVRTDLMAAYTLVHFIAFTALGAAATLAYARYAIVPRHALGLAAVLLALLTAGAVGVGQLVPGLVTAIGVLPLTVANASAALVMGTFIHRVLQGAASAETLPLEEVAAVGGRADVPNHSD